MQFQIEPHSQYAEDAYVRHKGKQLASMFQDEEHRGIEYDVKHDFAPRSVLPPPKVISPIFINSLTLPATHGSKVDCFLEETFKEAR